MKIERTRYVAMRKNRTEIWCGCARKLSFRKLEDLKQAEIRTYRSEKQAINAVTDTEEPYEAVEVHLTLDFVGDEPMTRKQWVAEHYPKCVNDDLVGGVESCPYSYNDMPDKFKPAVWHDDCDADTCGECWNKPMVKPE